MHGRDKMDQKYVSSHFYELNKPLSIFFVLDNSKQIVTSYSTNPSPTIEHFSSFNVTFLKKIEKGLKKH